MKINNKTFAALMIFGIMCFLIAIAVCFVEPEEFVGGTIVDKEYSSNQLYLVVSEEDGSIWRHPVNLEVYMEYGVGDYYSD